MISKSAPRRHWPRKLEGPRASTKLSEASFEATSGQSSLAPTWAGLAEVRAMGSAAGVAVRQERAAARAADIAPMIAELQAEGVTSLGRLATALTERGIPTSRGADRWSPMQVSRVLKASAHVP